jgi:CO/xanthine dehydrogenase Mo-binding subunit
VRWKFPTITAKKQRFANQNQLGNTKKGMGIAAFLHGAGFTGSGERYLSSVVGVEGCADGSVRVLVSSTEFGQGTNTVLSQIAAEALGLPYENVSMAQPDTLQVPNSGPNRRIAHGDGGWKAGAVRGPGN